MKGRIMKSTGSWYDVLGEDDQIYQARTRGRFRLDNAKTTNPVAVGDLVMLQAEGSNEAVITEILPRENYIIRQSVHKKGHAHILASNIDQAVIIATLTRPRTSTGFIDRFLVTAESFRIPQVLVLNKTDAFTAKEQKKATALLNVYKDIGVRCLLTSAKNEEGIDELMQVLLGKVSLISGHSGVGKSTLINLLSPHIAQKTAEVSNFANKGVHTTTFAEMFRLKEETFIIDTPGIKELALVDIPPEELGDYFPEIREFQQECKFNNCIHVSEPRCAVKEAVEQGNISEVRYKSYLSMLDGDVD